jgi:mannosylglycerate hydrolase
MGKRLNVVNHTHWDREWYESYETFRGKLVEGIKLILKGLGSGQFQSFMLDGQTIVLEDLEEVLETHYYEKLMSYIKEKKISIGPWYVLPDEFLVSGESLIRNLQLGIEISKELGTEEFIGYLPDTFGHIGQLPQIFKELGICWSLLFRGVGKGKDSEVRFIGSDGTEIKSLVLPLWTGYYNHFLTYEDYRERLRKYIEEITPYCTGEELLLLNGADHLIPCSVLKDRLAVLSKELNIDIRQTSVMDYVKNFENKQLADIIEGEQRDENKAYILTNVASARTYLKVQNQELEDEITHVAEPMELIKSLVGSEYKAKFLKQVWKTMLKNHPHDSICGCSIDKVHREMVTRSEKAKDMLLSIEYYAAKELITSQPIDNDKLFIFNPHPYEVKTTVVTTVLQRPDRGFIGLEDENGNRIPLHTLSRERKSVFKADVDLEPNWYDVNEYKIAFEVALKGIGFKELKIVEGSPSNIINSSGSSLENQYIKLWVNEKGYVDILNKVENKLYKNCNKFISSMDGGDEYTYSPPFDDCISESRFLGIRNMLISSPLKELTLIYEIEQPEGLREDRKGPALRKIKSELKTTIRLRGNSNTVEFETEINNRARDHRLRVLFPAGKKIEEYYTDVSFDLVKRVPLKEVYYDAERMKEVKVNTFPTDSYVYLKDGFSILHRGLQECEVTSCETEQDGVYLTILRAVGWLSRDDIRTRGGGAGPKFQTPEAQCIGCHTFSYALTFSDNPACEAKLFRTVPRVFAGVSIKPGVENLLSLSNSKLIISAFYKNEKGDITLRIYNPSNQIEKFRIHCPWQQVFSVDLLNNKKEVLSTELCIESKKIMTLCFR